MRYSQRLIVAITAAVTVASAFVNEPHFLAQRSGVQEYHRYKLAVAYDPVQDRWDSSHSPVLRAQSVAKFCSEIGCTIQAYQDTTSKLKRRKKELAKQMLMVEDELDRLETESQKHRTMHQIFDSVEIQAFSSSLWSLLPKSLQDHVNPEPYFSDMNSESQRETAVILRDRQQKLSNRALAIQNLLVTLQVMEYTSAGATKKLAVQYKTVAEEERINIFATSKRKSKISDWNSVWPQPPRRPPTMKQFMNQHGNDDADIGTNTYYDNHVNDDSTPEWFARERVSAHPFPDTTAAYKREGKAPNRYEGTRGVIFPFLSNHTLKP